MALIRTLAPFTHGLWRDPLAFDEHIEELDREIEGQAMYKKKLPTKSPSAAAHPGTTITLLYIFFSPTNTLSVSEADDRLR